MNEIETIDLLSSDSDTSSSELIQNVRESEKESSSFLSKRMRQVAQETSTFLFEEDVKDEKTTPKPPLKKSLFSADMLNRKRTINQELDDSMIDGNKRMNATIPHKRSTFSCSMESSIPSALKEVGVTEEEDRQNTSEVRQIINNYSNQNDVSLHDLLNSILSDADLSNSSIIPEAVLSNRSVELSEEDMSILRGAGHLFSQSQQESSVIVSEADSIVNDIPDNSMEAMDAIEEYVYSEGSQQESVQTKKSQQESVPLKESQQESVYSDESHQDSVHSEIPEVSHPAPHEKVQLPTQQEKEPIIILSLSSSTDSEDNDPSAIDSQLINTLSSNSSDAEESDGNTVDPILQRILTCEEKQPTPAPEVNKPSLENDSFNTSFEQHVTETSAFNGIISDYLRGCTQPEADSEATISSDPEDLNAATQPVSLPPAPTAAPPVVPTPSFPLPSPVISKSRTQKHKTLLVCFEELLSNQEQGKKVIDAIRPSCLIGPTIQCPAHGIVLFMRQIDEEFVIIQDCLAMIMDGHAMISLIKEHGLEGGLNHIREVRARLLASTQQPLYLVLTNMQGIITEQRRKRRQSILPFTKDLLTELYIRLRLDCGITCFPCESETEATEWMMKIIQCVRDGPYLQPLTELSVASKGKTMGLTYKDTFNEKELGLFRMLQCIPGVSTTKALAILQHYKSIAEILQAYKRLPTLQEKEDMLSDKMGGTTRQRQLSKRIYESFFCTNSNHELLSICSNTS